MATKTQSEKRFAEDYGQGDWLQWWQIHGLPSSIGRVAIMIGDHPPMIRFWKEDKLGEPTAIPAGLPCKKIEPPTES